MPPGGDGTVSTCRCAEAVSASCHPEEMTLTGVRRKNVVALSKGRETLMIEICSMLRSNLASREASNYFELQLISFYAMRISSSCPFYQFAWWDEHHWFWCSRVSLLLEEQVHNEVKWLQ